LDNLHHREKGFLISELPKTFQDAIRVTRELGVQYLWIDSICIIQHEEDKIDWGKEARRMQEYYSSAYCTIAATSAADYKTGFLKQKDSSKYIRIQDASGRRFFVCDDIDDFENDVEKAKINTRAWVMQERVLSRRIIHFAANQIYWECGQRVYCQNLTILQQK
jgi:hypothetical protein